MRKKKPTYTITKLVCPQTLKNEYLLTCSGEAAVIDVSGTYSDIARILDEKNLHLKYILVSHAHRSHLQAISRLKEKYNAVFYMHPYDMELLKKVEPDLVPDFFLKDNQTLKLGPLTLKTMHTPGHTKGSLSFLLKGCDTLFSGSTLLKGGYGKIWGPKSMSLMLFSLKRINYSIYADTIVYPRSGEETTIGKESWINCLRSA